MAWPRGITVGFTDVKVGNYVRLNNINLTPEEARRIAQELLLVADFQDRTPDTRLVDGWPKRVGIQET